MIIDSHVHIFPDAIVARAMANLQRHSPQPLAADGTLRGLLASMAAARISRSVALPVSTKPDQVKSINRFTGELNKNPNIIAFGALHPDLSDFRDEIKRLKEAGIPGVKMHPDHQGFDADEPRLFPVYEELARAGLILLLHAGENINLREAPRATPAQLARIVKLFPHLTLVAAHLGGWRMWDEVEQCLVGTSIWLDTSFALGEMGAEQFLRIIRNHGIEKVIFGSDSPWLSQAESLRALVALPLTKDEKNALLWKNAARLLSLPKAGAVV